MDKNCLSKFEEFGRDKSKLADKENPHILKNDSNCFVAKKETNIDMTKMFKPSPFYGIGNLDDESVPMIENKQQRKIDDVPYKVLDAPELSDDFYLNLVDWSDSNMLAVGLLNRVYTWSASGSPIVKLHEFE